MQRPLVIATAALLVVHVFWLACRVLDAPATGFAAALLWVTVPVAAFAVALAAANRRFLAGLAVSAPAALLFVLSNAALQAFGHRVDFPGLLGALLVFGMSFPVSALLAATGAGLALLSPFHPV